MKIVNSFVIGLGIIQVGSKIKIYHSLYLRQNYYGTNSFLLSFLLVTGFGSRAFAKSVHLTCLKPNGYSLFHPKNSLKNQLNVWTTKVNDYFIIFFDI